MLNILFRIRGEVNIKKLISKGMIVGENCSFQPGVSIDRTFCWLIEFGNDVTLAPRVVILAHDASMKRHLGYSRIGKVKIGNKVFIGAGTVVLPNVVIGDNVIIGAGTVVTKSIPENVVAAGNPVRIISSIDDFILKHKQLIEVGPCFEESRLNNLSDQIKKDIVAKVKHEGGYIV